MISLLFSNKLLFETRDIWVLLYYYAFNINELIQFKGSEFKDLSKSA